jgi:hypothetical protein
MSSNMKMMMAMMAQGGMSPDGGFNMNNLAKDSTLELNAAHPIIVNLN